MLTRLRRITHHLLQPDCAFCGEPRLPDYPLCQACHDDLPWLAAHHNHAIPGCDNSISAFAYQTPISSLLLSIKFGKRLRDLTTLGELTAVGILPQISQLPQAILPVPLHPQRLHERGFNQALELARPLAKQLGIPLLTRTVVRQKATLRQTELDSTQRQQNVLQAFHLNTPLPYTRIALFDDVITTGATLRSLAQLLRANGVQHLEAWSCARPIQRQKHEFDRQID